MIIESWMVSGSISLAGLIAVLAVSKYKIDENKSDIRKVRQILDNKVESLRDTTNAHKVKFTSTPSMEKVRAEFVSKEMFKQMEKYMDGKFKTLENGIDKILFRLDK